MEITRSNRVAIVEVSKPSYTPGIIKGGLLPSSVCLACTFTMIGHFKVGSHRSKPKNILSNLQTPLIFSGRGSLLLDQLEELIGNPG